MRHNAETVDRLRLTVIRCFNENVEAARHLTAVKKLTIEIDLHDANCRTRLDTAAQNGEKKRDLRAI